MKYVVYKLKFSTAVHFGNGTLDDTEYTFCADTLFSALCIEAVKSGTKRLERLVNWVKAGSLVFSDALPYIDDTFYVPKPMCEIKYSGEKSGDSSSKKLYKKISYIPYDSIEDYINGNLAEDIICDFINSYGKKDMKVSAAINNNEETVPYRVGVYYYNEGNGVYIIVGYDSDEVLYEAEELLISLGYSGIGGERSSGLGRYELEMSEEAEELLDMINEKAETYMTLSISLPKENEMEEALAGARYNIIKRSGFIASTACTDRRKKDMYVIAAGACVNNKYVGDVYNVAQGESHAVYRYAKPLFMGVNV